MKEEKLVQAKNEEKESKQQDFISVIVGKEVFKFSNDRSLFIFSINNPLRRFCLETITKKYFHYFVSISVVINSLTLANINYSQRVEENVQNSIIGYINFAFTILYLLELIMKVIAMGLVLNMHSYLRDPLNWLDVIIVIGGIIGILPTFSYLTTNSAIISIRNVRVLRPFKLFNNIESLKALSNTLFKSIRGLLHVSIFLICVFTIFGIIGVQYYSSAFYSRCRLTEEPLENGEWPISKEFNRPCSLFEGIGYQCPQVNGQTLYCGNSIAHGMTLFEDGVNRDPKIQFGIPNFDHIFKSFQAQFEMITKANWSPIMLNMMDVNYKPIAIIYSVLIIMVTSDFLMNLILGVFIDVFKEVRFNAEKNRQQELEKEMKMNQHLSSESIKRLSQELCQNQSRIRNLLDKNSFIMSHSFVEDNSFVNLNVNSAQVKQEVIDSTAQTLHTDQGMAHKDNFIQVVTKPTQGILSRFFNKQDTNKSKVNDVPQTKNPILIQLQNRMINLSSIQDLNERIKQQEFLRAESILFLRKNKTQLIENYLNSRKTNYGLNDENIFISVLQGLIKNRYERNFEEFGEEAQDNLKILSVKLYDKLILGFQKRLILKKMAEGFLKLRVERQYIEILQGRISEEIKHAFIQKRKIKYTFTTPFIWLCNNRFYQIIILACVFTNVLILTLDRLYISKEEEDILLIFNRIFYAVYVVEMIVKLIAMGFQQYFCDRYNTFDCFLVITQTIDLALSYALNTSASKALQAFKGIRLIRSFKLVREWTQLQNLLSVMQFALRDLWPLSLYFLIFMFTYTILGKEWFAYKLKFDSDFNVDLENGKSLDPNFNTFVQGFTTAFTVLTSDNWGDIFNYHFRGISSIKSGIFFISLKVIGHYIILLLLLAILIEHFDENSLNKEEINFDKSTKSGPKLFTFLKLKYNNLIKLFQNKRKLQYQLEEKVTLPKETKWTKFQQSLIKFIEKPKFEGFIIAIIIISSIHLMLDSPLLDPKGTMALVLNILDYIITIIFSLESFIKILAYGFLFNGDKSFLRNIWNIFDFTIVICSWTSILIQRNQLHTFKILRVLRILRPLKLIKQYEGLRISLDALISSIISIFNILLISFFFFILFGTLGVNLFKGLFYQCDYSKINSLPNFNEDEIITKWDCLNSGGEYLKREQDFDSIGHALKVLFFVSQLCSWSTPMFQSGYTVGIDMVQKQDASLYNMLYFVIFVIVLNFFIVSLLVGVIVSSYNRQKEKNGKDYFITEKQKKLVQAKMVVVSVKPELYLKKPKQVWRKCFHKISVSIIFEKIINFVLVLNILVYCLVWPGQTKEFEDILKYIGIVFTAFFLFEAIIKIVGLGLIYFRIGQNIFDFLIVVISVVATIMDFFTNTEVLMVTSAIRVFRIGRIFKLFRNLKSIHLIFQAFMLSLPYLLNVGGLLLLLFFMYSILTMNYFAAVKFNGIMQDNLNFMSVQNAAISLFVIHTSNNFFEVSYAVGLEKSITFDCIEDPTYEDYNQAGQTVGCGNSLASMVIFFSFWILVVLVFINLFIAIILQGYSFSVSNYKKWFNISIPNKFQKAWSQIDQDATGFIKKSQFHHLLMLLGEPLGWDSVIAINYNKQQEFLSYVNQSLGGEEKIEMRKVFEYLLIVAVVQEEMKLFLKDVMGVKVEKVKKERKSILQTVKEIGNMFNMTKRRKGIKSTMDTGMIVQMKKKNTQHLTKQQDLRLEEFD